MNESAQRIAAAVVGAAREHNWIGDHLTTVPELADIERELFLQMMTALRRKQDRNPELNLDEISSMFTFVFAKSAEMLTDYVNGKPFEPDMAGLFDGKVPLYVDERIVKFYKQCDYPTLAAEAFLNREPDDAEPLLALFEALKWCFRVSVDISIRQLEGCGVRFG